MANVTHFTPHLVIRVLQPTPSVLVESASVFQASTSLQPTNALQVRAASAFV